MFTFDRGKYRGILISIGLFLILDASVLFYNFYLSLQIEENVRSLNLAARQRTLTESMVNSLFVLNGADQSPEVLSSSVDELLISQLLFDDTLLAFLEGGEVSDTRGDLVNVGKINSNDGQQLLAEAFALWGPYKAAIQVFSADFQRGRPIINSLDKAVTLARADNTQLSMLMNNLTSDFEQSTIAKANRLRYVQAAGFALAIINFLVLVLYSLRRLVLNDKIADHSKQENIEILNTVNEGLFLLDENLLIGNQCSASLKTMLGRDNISGQNFMALLANIVSEKDADTARGFIELLFDQRVKEKLVGDLNPLSSVEVNIAQASGGFLTKHLRFNFARAYKANAISHVLVTVLDITQQVKLEKALAESKKQGENQLAMLTSLLHTQPPLLKEFIDNSYHCYNKINEILRIHDKSITEVRDKASSIYKLVHNFKGEAASLRLEYFENTAHAMEDTLSTISNKKHLSGNDYLPLTVQLEGLITYTQQVEQLAAKLSQFGMTVTGGNSPSKITSINSSSKQLSDTWKQLYDLVGSLADRNGKAVQLVTSGLNDVNLDSDYQHQIKEICIQLLRNAVAHGIETPEDRQLVQKPLRGRIDLRLAKLSNSELELSIMDDGRGIDYEALRNKALATGRWTKKEVETWTRKNLLSLIFNEGLSTSNKVTKDTGRGVGMGTVMSRIVEHRGKINVSSKKGHHCRFTITLPIIPPAQSNVAVNA